MGSHKGSPNVHLIQFYGFSLSNRRIVESLHFRIFKLVYHLFPEVLYDRGKRIGHGLPQAAFGCKLHCLA